MSETSEKSPAPAKQAASRPAPEAARRGAAEAPPRYGIDFVDQAGRLEAVEADQAASAPAPGSVHEAARAAMSGPGEPLEFIEQIQRSFGRHDVTGVRRHTGPHAARAVKSLGADAISAGGRIALARPPTLRLLAHELTHVVQQRGAPMHVTGAAAETGDPHERHADTVAEKVVQGQSAEALLDTYAPPTGAPPREAPAPQQPVVQRQSSAPGPSATARAEWRFEYEWSRRGKKPETIDAALAATKQMLGSLPPGFVPPPRRAPLFPLLIPDATPAPINPLKLQIARQMLGQEAGSYDPAELIGPRADVALAETIDLPKAFGAGGPAPNIDEITAAALGRGKPTTDGQIRFVGTNVPSWMTALRAGTGARGEMEIWSAAGMPVVKADGSYLLPGGDGKPVRRNSIASDANARQLEQVVAPAIEVAASGGQRTLADGRVLDDAQWSTYVWQRFTSAQAEAHRSLTNLAEGVALWNEAQSGLAAMASAPAHLLGGRSSTDSDRILAETLRDVDIELAQITKALTPAQVARAEQLVKNAVRRGESQFYDYKEDVFAGGERTITGIKVVAVGAVASVAAPALFAWAGGAAAAGVGTNLAATGLSSLGSGMLTGSLGGLLESVDRGFTMANYGKGFAENFMSGFTAGLGAGGSVLLKLEGPMTMATLGKTMALHGATGALEATAGQALHNATDLDPTIAADDPRRSLLGAALRGALKGAGTAGLGKLTGGLSSSKVTNAVTDHAFDVALDGVIAAVEGGSREDILAAMLQSGVGGLVKGGLSRADKRWGGRLGAAKKPPIQRDHHDDHDDHDDGDAAPAGKKPPGAAGKKPPAVTVAGKKPPGTTDGAGKKPPPVVVVAGQPGKKPAPVTIPATNQPVDPHAAALAAIRSAGHGTGGDMAAATESAIGKRGGWKTKLKDALKSLDGSARKIAEDALVTARDRIVDEEWAKIQKDYPDLELENVGTRSFGSDIDATVRPKKGSEAAKPGLDMRKQVKQSAEAAQRLSDALRQRVGGETDTVIDTNIYSFIGEGKTAPTSPGGAHARQRADLVVGLAEQMRGQSKAESRALAGRLTARLEGDPAAAKQAQGLIADAREFHDARGREWAEGRRRAAADPANKGASGETIDRVAREKLLGQKKAELADLLGGADPDSGAVTRKQSEINWFAPDAYATPSAFQQAVAHGQRLKGTARPAAELSFPDVAKKLHEAAAALPADSPRAQKLKQDAARVERQQRLMASTTSELAAEQARQPPDANRVRELELRAAGLRADLAKTAEPIVVRELLDATMSAGRSGPDRLAEAAAASSANVGMLGSHTAHAQDMDSRVKAAAKYAARVALAEVLGGQKIAGTPQQRALGGLIAEFTKSRMDVFDEPSAQILDEMFLRYAKLKGRPPQVTQALKGEFVHDVTAWTRNASDGLLAMAITAMPGRDIGAELLAPTAAVGRAKTGGGPQIDLPVRTGNAPPSAIATVRGAPYAITADTPEPTRHYLQTVLSGRNYASEAELHREAQLWRSNLPAEVAIMGATRTALQDTSSPEFLQSAQMAHAARAIWADIRLGKAPIGPQIDLGPATAGLGAEPLSDAQLRRSLVYGILHPESAGPTSAVGDGRWTTARDPAALSAYDMIINRKAGPLSPAQLAFGAELLSTSGLLWTKYEDTAALPEFSDFRRRSRVDAVRKDAAGKHTHSTSAPGGMVLDGDLGVRALRDAGLSIASGVSGTSSDTALLQRWAETRHGVPAVAPGLSPEAAATASKALLLYFFRDQVVPESMAGSFNAPGAARSQLGLAPMSVSKPNVAVHTYGEISLGYDLTMQGTTNVDVKAIAAAVARAAEELRRSAPPDPSRPDYLF